MDKQGSSQVILKVRLNCIISNTETKIITIGKLNFDLYMVKLKFWYSSNVKLQSVDIWTKYYEFLYEHFS